MKIYTGIGSRDVPLWAALILEQAGERLASEGWILRSGGAPGCDKRFQAGASKYQTPYHIYLPKEPFFGLTSNSRNCLLPEKRWPLAWTKAKEIAASLHPNWPAVVNKGFDKLMTRNIFQILGEDLQSPSRFVLCWAERSTFKEDTIINVSGGTGQAVRLAAKYSIPVYNINELAHLQKIAKWLNIEISEEALAAVSKKSSLKKVTP